MSLWFRILSVAHSHFRFRSLPHSNQSKQTITPATRARFVFFPHPHPKPNTSRIHPFSQFLYNTGLIQYPRSCSSITSRLSDTSSSSAFTLQDPLIFSLQFNHLTSRSRSILSPIFTAHMTSLLLTPLSQTDGGRNRSCQCP